MNSTFCNIFGRIRTPREGCECFPCRVARIVEAVERSPFKPADRAAAEPANATQVGGEHYKRQAIQPWDYIIANQLGFLEGNVVKYVTRHRGKGGVEDLRKARHYLDKLIEVELANASQT